MFQRKKLLVILTSSLILLAACADSSNSNPPETGSLSLNLQLPDSLTGRPAVQNRSTAFKSVSNRIASKADIGEPCSYRGVDNDDEIFDNGYKTTRFMVSTMATWTCIADLIIDVAASLPHDGSMVETDNDTQAENYDPSEPTHYSVSELSDTQTSARMYYGYDRANPPTANSRPQFFISWNSSADNNAEGRMIIAARDINGDTINPDDPVNMRMDFRFDNNHRQADMFLKFDETNSWADGMRIEIDKVLTASPLEQVYTARGMINMKAQFLPVSGISEVPAIQFYTVADQLGNGAAIEEIQNMSLPLELNAATANHLGNYLFTKKDIYFFKDDSDWEYINKVITSATYRGARNTPASGGSWVPFNPSQDMIISALGLEAGYFNAALCGEIGASCIELLNAVFEDGFAGQEKNQGSDPLDWRSNALENASYLDSVYPNGVNWDGAFELSFIPAG